MPELFKPVIYLTINGKRFHWADSPQTPNAVIVDFEYEDTDGTDSKDSKKKGNRDQLIFKFKDFDSENQVYRSDSSLFKIGNIVRFRWGFEGSIQLPPERVMKIVDVSTSFPNSGIEMASVTCHDLSKQGNIEEKDILRPVKGRTKDEKSIYTFNQVVTELAEESKLRHINSDPTFDKLTSNKGWQQKKETNIHFLQRMASEYGAEVYVERKNLTFSTKKRIIKKRSWGFLHRGVNEQFFSLQQQGRRVAQLLSFTPKTNLEDAAHTVTGGDKSTKTNKKEDAESKTTTSTTVSVSKDTGIPGSDVITKVEGGAGDDPKASVIKKEAKKKKLQETPKDEQDAKARAEGKQQESNEQALTASAVVDGDQRLAAKTMVITTGRLSKRWTNMKWYIKSVTHNIGSGGYTCDLELTAPPKIDADEGKNSAKKKAQDTKVADTVDRKREINKDTGKQGNFIDEVRDGKTGKLKRVVKRPS